MAIVDARNKKRGITYVYESHSYWGKELKQPRSTRKLLGKRDPLTGEVVPTGPRGKRKDQAGHASAGGDAAADAKATTPEELTPMRGSKYVQSDLQDSLQECQRELQTGRKVLFSGTPCQIAGLLHSLEGKKVDNLLTVELICHGTPMPAVFQEYLRQVEKKLGDTISDFHFRTKSPSWEEFQLQVSGKTKAIPSFLGTLFDSPYGKAFLLNLSLRDSCYHCPAKGGKSQAGITLGIFGASTHSTRNSMTMKEPVPYFAIPLKERKP